MATETANGRTIVLDEAPRGGELVRYTVPEMEVMARHAAASQLFGMTAPQAFTLMLICQAEGLHPIQALRRYHIIEGKPSMRADAMLAEFQRHGGQVEWLETNDEGCVAIFHHPRQCPDGQRVQFTRADAERADLLGRKNWQRYPGPMCRARVISVGIRMILPGIIAGIYTPEETMDSLDAGGPPARPVRREPYPGAVKPETAPQPTPSNEPAADSGAGPGSISDLRAFIRARLRAANDELRDALEFAGKPQDDVRPVICNEYRLVNALLSQWIAEGLVERSEIETADGKRDRQRSADVLLGMYRELKEDVETDIIDLVRHYRYLAFRSHELEPPGDRDEAQATADEDPAGAGE